MRAASLMIPLGMSLLLTACVTPSTRSGPPAPIYDKGENSASSTTGSQPSASGSAETAPLGGPEISIGQPSSTTSGVPQPESASSAPAPTTVAYIPQAPKVKPAAPMSSASRSLVTQADSKYNSGDLTGAASLLERAVRVDPRHPLPWNRLARVRLAQGNHRLASELAEKSNAMAGGDRAVQRDNWLVISEAKRASGDFPGARNAQRKADALR